MSKNLRWLIILLLATLCSAGLASAASAQTISQTLGNGNFNNTFQGQSFTATVTGTLTQIEVRARTSTATTVRFYNGTGSGVVDGVGSPVLSQSVTLVAQPDNLAGFQTIILTTPLPIVAGSSYAFVFDAGTLAVNTGGSVYAGGTWVTNYAAPFSTIDAAFTATQVPTPAPVPTLSEWAMILFGAILAGGAALYIQRRRQFS